MSSARDSDLDAAVIEALADHVEALAARVVAAEADADRLAAVMERVVEHFRCLADEEAALAGHYEALKARNPPS